MNVDLDVEAPFNVLGRFVGLGFSLVWAGVVILVAVVFSRWFRRRAGLLLTRRRVDDNIVLLFDNLIKLAVGIAAAALAFGFLAHDFAFLVTSLGITTVALLLSLQDLVKNVVAGFYLLAEQPFRIGDRIMVGEFAGRVEHVDVRATTLRSDRGQQVLVPNFTIVSEVVVDAGASPLTPLVLLIDGAGDRPGDGAALRAVVAGLGWPAEPTPEVEVVKDGPAGRDLRVTLWQPADDPGSRTIVSAVRAHFPEATVTRA